MGTGVLLGLIIHHAPVKTTTNNNNVGSLCSSRFHDASGGVMCGMQKGLYKLSLFFNNAAVYLN